MSRMVLLLAVLCILLTPDALCCIFKYGEDPRHAFAKPGTLHFSYDFAGLDWKGVCENGTWQSPINIPSRVSGKVSASDRTILDYRAIKSNGTNVKIINNGHVIQVEWTDGLLQSTSSVAVPSKDGLLLETLSSGDKPHRIPITPLQFHFHGHSEHSIGGAFYPVELHIVSHAISEHLAGCTGAKACLTVIGVMLALADDDADNPHLEDIFQAASLGTETMINMPAGKVVDLNALLPNNKSYVTYSGSLTTPPCSENVLWHVMLQPIRMSTRQMKAFLHATGDMNCTGDAKPLLRHSNVNYTVKETQGKDEEDNEQTCVKLGAGQNYRVIQPTSGRALLTYIDESGIRVSDGMPSTTTTSRPASSGRARVQWSIAVYALLLLGPMMVL